ncbi:fungal specific transcription [Pyrenophora seminiperda CCB06]|uniref:Fungal specific transcription n=1 Tax=Pyrenophora seminiperda CCB06 TaxID=1302712 RepID=A0A3M7MGF1_9PLEO|nr:fungal specific transcription [Pyrenophora seminiperda CCB06]
MKFLSLITPACLLGIAASVDMSRYSAGSAVDVGFKPFLKELYASAEDPSATTKFTNFFTTDGQLIVLTNTATGSEQIIKLKEELLPPAGNKHWNHLPNVTTVASETSAKKTYQVLGVIETRFDGGNCSQAYYSSRFTVTKDTSGSPQLTPHTGSLVAYDDFIVSPSKSPTNIECGN